MLKINKKKFAEDNKYFGPISGIRTVQKFCQKLLILYKI